MAKIMATDRNWAVRSGKGGVIACRQRSQASSRMDDGRGRTVAEGEEQAGPLPSIQLL